MNKKKKAPARQEIRHEYSCNNPDCNAVFEEWLPFGTIKRRKKCPTCKKHTLGTNYSTTVIYYPGIHEAKTVGQCAEINRKRQGKELCEKMVDEDAYYGPRKAGLKQIPWWRSGKHGTTKSEKPIDLTKIKDTDKYIMTGETN